MPVTWKIFYDPTTLGKDPAVVGDYWRVADAVSASVDEVATPEAAPENGVIGVIYTHSRVGRRVLWMADYYVYRRALPLADPNQWTLGDETLVYATIERGEVPGMSLSGDPAAPYTVPRNGNGVQNVATAGLLTSLSSRQTTIKRGVYVAEDHMERTLIAMHNDPDLPPRSNWPPDPAWIPQPDPDA